MPISPNDVIFPKNRIKRLVRVLHDGTRNDPRDFSIAELEFHDGNSGYGIRYNLNGWNDNNPDLGYPTVRPGRPTWFILPEIKELLPVLNQLFATNP